MPLLRTWDDLHPQPYVVCWNGTLARQAARAAQRPAPVRQSEARVEYCAPGAVTRVLQAHPHGLMAREVRQLTGLPEPVVLARLQNYGGCSD